METWTCPNCRDMYELGMKLIHWASGNHISATDWVCVFCGAVMPSSHRPGCLHVLAVEYVEKKENEHSTDDKTRDRKENQPA